MEQLELSQLADFCWQRSELVVVDLKARDMSEIKIDEPRLPHVEPLQFGQQTELRRKRRELVVGDLKTTWLLVMITIQSLRQSHRELPEPRHVRNFARQRGKAVAGEVEFHQVLHAEQLGRHLRQTHESQLETVCES